MYDQDQSPLFGLPRELRDEIWAYATYGDEGYHHVFQQTCGILQLANGGEIVIPLKAACKRIAQEMKGIVLRTNTIHFFHNVKESSPGRNTDALRYKRLLEYIEVTKWRILLLCPPQWVIPEILEGVQQDHGYDFAAIYEQSRKTTWIPSLMPFDDWHRYHGRHPLPLNNAQQNVLEAVSAHPKFAEITALACSRDHPRDHFKDPPMFIEGSNVQFLRWKPVPWAIPSDAEINAIEGLLIDNDLQRYMDFHMFKEHKWCFSACAVAIDAIQRLQTDCRRSLHAICLHEDAVAVAAPESHLRGLLPICRDNPSLKIDRRVRGFRAAFRSRWGSTLIAEWSRQRKHGAARYIEMLVEWMEEMRVLNLLNTQASSMKLTFEEDGDRIFWNNLRTAVQFQEIMLQSLHAKRESPRPISSDQMFMQHQYPLPCDFPAWLPHTFEALIAGEGNIEYEWTVDNEHPVLNGRDSLYMSTEEWRDPWLALIFQFLPTGIGPRIWEDFELTGTNLFRLD